MRLPVVIGLTAVILAGLTGCAGLKITDVKSGSPDSEFADRLALEMSKSEISVSLPLVESWNYNTGGAFGPGGPLLLDEHLIAGTRQGDVHAVGLENGKKVGSENFGDAVNGTPALHESTMIVPVAWGSKKGLVAYNLETGRKKWSLRIPPVENSVVVLDGNVILVDNSSTLRSVNIDDGSENWALTLNPSVPVLSSPIEIAPFVVSVVDAEGVITAVNTTSGQVVWTRELNQPVRTDAVTDGLRTYYSTTRGRLFAVANATGEVLWQNVVGSDDVRLVTAALFGDRIVVGASSGLVSVFERESGMAVWETSTIEAVAAKPLVTQDYIFVSSMDRMIRAFDRESGAERWHVLLKGRAKTEMLALENRLIVSAEPRLIYKFVTENTDVALAE